MRDDLWAKCRMPCWTWFLWIRAAHTHIVIREIHFVSTMRISHSVPYEKVNQNNVLTWNEIFSWKENNKTAQAYTDTHSCMCVTVSSNPTKRFIRKNRQFCLMIFPVVNGRAHIERILVNDRQVCLISSSLLFVLYASWDATVRTHLSFCKEATWHPNYFMAKPFALTVETMYLKCIA